MDTQAVADACNSGQIGGKILYIEEENYLAQAILSLFFFVFMVSDAVKPYSPRTSNMSKIGKRMGFLSISYD